MSFFPSLKPRLIPVLLLVVFCFTFLNVDLAKAQMDANITKSYDLNTVKETVKTVKEKVKKGFFDATIMGTLKAMEYVLKKISYDVAVSLASGNWGQSPLFHEKSVGNYLAGVAGDALGSALDEFGKGIGFNLCTLPDPKLDLTLKLGLHMEYGPPKPTCSFQQLKDSYNLDNIRSKYWGKDGESFSKMFNTSLNITDTDVGIGMSAKAQIDAYAIQKEADAKAQREEGKGMKTFSAAISGNVLTPAEVTRDMVVKAGKAEQDAQASQKNTVYMAGALTAGSIQVLKNVASNFIETFVGTAKDNFLNKGMFPFGLGKIKCVPNYLKIGGLNIDTCVDTKYTAEGYYEDGNVSTYRQEASMLFAELLVTKTKYVEAYDLLSKFQTCNYDTSDTAENCILDEDFANILRQVEISGEGITLLEALNSPVLKLNDFKVVGPNMDGSMETRSNRCFESAYCYENIKVLRKARVLPLGFEIAALQTGAPLKLSEILAQFNNASSPYYKLINPNWILKMPASRCKAITYNTQTLTNVNEMRQEECADLQSCVGYDSKGKCNAFGYCLEEKNIWRFSADYCDKQFDTCKAFTSSEGKNVAYLQKNLDNNWCTKENTGCAFYTNYQDVDGKWQAVSQSINAINSSVQPQTTPDEIGAYTNNNSFFFNNKVLACDAGNAGCSRMYEARNLQKEILLKKAPDYLRCYDSDNNINNGIQWPKNFSELNKIKPPDATKCNGFASVCLPEEENCDIYNLLQLPIFKDSKALNETITGKFTPAITTADNQRVWNDQCDARCVGYNSYKEVVSRYSNGNDLVYIIPTTTASCDVADEGCSAFVNLSSVQNGQEQTEYYSDLRLCILPDKNKQKNFYTYEGIENGGYQLKGYTLLKDANGAPKQIFRDQAEQEEFGTCDSDRAVSDLSGDCKSFKDDQGNIFYAFLTKTVVSSDKCTPYRISKPEFYTGTKCIGSYGDEDEEGNGEVVFYDTSTGYCIYNGLPQGVSTLAGESRTCEKEMVSCRKYKGNTGNVIENVVEQTFENSGIVLNGTDTSSSWGPNPLTSAGATLSISTESLTNPGKSLKVMVKNSSEGFAYYNDKIVNGLSYNISFLAKGKGSIQIKIGTSASEENVGQITLTDNWRRYEFSTDVLVSNIQLAENTGATLYFRPVSSEGVDKIVFLDNVLIKSIKDTVSLVKNKLSVDSICDADQTDNLPGEGLGCRAYKKNTGNEFYLRNFNYLCRDGAVGCTKLVDTYNKSKSIEINAWQVFNLWLPKPATSNAPTINFNGKDYGCIVQSGEDGCYVNAFGIGQGGSTGSSFAYNTSTILVYKNTNSSTSPIYLAVKTENYCREENVGCSLLGKGSLSVSNTYSFEDTYVINSPERYDSKTDGILCSKEAEGCNTWTSGAGNYYFKDPEIVGEKVCVYKEETKNNIKTGKWVLKADENIVCPTDSTFAPPAYGSANYKGNVGECPTDQNGCSRFDDHSDILSKKCSVSGVKCELDKDCAGGPTDTCSDIKVNSYFLIDNGRLTEKVSEECSGASLNYGCILMDKVSNPKKTFDTKATYQESADKEGAKVTPLSTNDNDANILLKVSRDRECNLWAYCDSYQVSDGQAKCYHFGLCQSSLPGMFSEGNCQETVVSKDWKWINSKMAKTNYQDRPINWSDAELSGYSLYDSYQIPSLGVRWVRVKIPEDTKPYSTNADPIVSSGEQESFTPRLVHYENPGIINNTTYCNKFDNTMATACISGEDSDQKGRCLGGECIFPINTDKAGDMLNTGLSCRGYPEEDSPFDPWGIIKTNNGKTPPAKSGYEYESGIKNNKLNICTTAKEDDSCDCSYNKADYGSQIFYLPTGIEKISDNVCVGGTGEGKECGLKNSDTTIVEAECTIGGGYCTKLSSKKTVMGWSGYCVEKNPKFDLYGQEGEKACLTWWPVEVPPGAPDIWIVDPKASYDSNTSRDRYMCIANNPVKTKPLPQVAFAVNKGQPVEKENETGGAVEYKNVGVELVKYCNYAGDDKTGCMDIEGKQKTGFNINLAKGKVVYKEEEVKDNLCICTQEIFDAGGCADDAEVEDEMFVYQCTEKMEALMEKNNDKYNKCDHNNPLFSSTLNYFCYSDKIVKSENTLTYINDPNKYAVKGVPFAEIAGNSVPWSYELIRIFSGQIAGIIKDKDDPSISDAIKVIWEKISKAASISGQVTWASVDLISWLASYLTETLEIKTIHTYVSGALVYNLPPNAVVMQCYDDKKKQVVSTLHAPGGQGEKDNNRIFCPLVMNNGTVATMQQSVGTPSLNYKIKKSEVAKIDVVLGDNFCNKRVRGNGNVVDNGCDNSLVKNTFFSNNIISFENSDITGCVMDGNVCLAEDGRLDSPDCNIEGDNAGDVCITELKKDYVPQDENSDIKQLIKKKAYKITGKDVWEVITQAHVIDGDNKAPTIFGDGFPKIDDDGTIGFFYGNKDSLPSLEKFSRKDQENNGDTNGLGIRIIWDGEILKGVQLEVNDADKATAGVSFFFIVHFADGSCSEFAKVSKDSNVPNNQSASYTASDFKPVTWRLNTGKTGSFGANKEFGVPYFSTTYNIEELYQGKLQFTTSSPTINRIYQKGIVALDDVTKKDMTGWFTNATLLDPFLQTYYQNNKYKYSYSPELRFVRSALLDYENIEAKTAGIPAVYSWYTALFDNLFVEVFPTTSQKFTFKSELDCSNPSTGSPCDSIKIKPPIIAAPVELESGGELCNDFKEKGGKVDCKTFVLNTPAVNKSSCSQSLITGGADGCVISPNSDVALEFYSWADPAQMPVRRVMYKASELASEISLSARSIGNRKPLCTATGYCGAGKTWSATEADKYKYQIPCETDANCVFYDANNKDDDGTLNLITAKCIQFDSKLKSDPNSPDGFGNTKDTGCKDTPFEFHFSYTEQPGVGYPKVQVLDNWGWCSGDCKGGSYGPNGMENGGCYKDFTYGENHCLSINAAAWINYDRTIKIQ